MACVPIKKKKKNIWLKSSVYRLINFYILKHIFINYEGFFIHEKQMIDDNLLYKWVTYRSPVF